MGDVLRDAILSPCGSYRFRLTRRWERGATALFVMLNPSVADAARDDPTLRRCVGFARREGFAAVEVVNLSPLRATNPRELLTHRLSSEVVVENRLHIANARASAGLVIAAWGSWGDRLPHLLGQAGLEGAQLVCLGITKGGQPRHPLYVRANTELVPWQLPSS
ncbi:MAG: DUF1643 domain-containing protein [Proteobacteria bacterium]|nr:DUF1643 domain-containing protein [Pseudomonadota bacterium]